MSLKKFVDQQNVWNRVYNRPVYDLKKMTPAQYKEIVRALESALSPENLSCDGELRGPALKAKQRLLFGAMDELEALGYTVEY